MLDFSFFKGRVGYRLFPLPSFVTEIPCSYKICCLTRPPPPSSYLNLTSEILNLEFFLPKSLTEWFTIKKSCYTIFLLFFFLFKCVQPLRVDERGDISLGYPPKSRRSPSVVMFSSWLFFIFHTVFFSFGTLFFLCVYIHQGAYIVLVGRKMLAKNIKDERETCAWNGWGNWWKKGRQQVLAASKSSPLRLKIKRGK